MGYPMLEYPPEVSASSTVPSGGGGDYLFAYKGSKQCALYALQNSSRRSSESRRGSSSQALDGAAKSGSARRRHTVKLTWKPKSPQSAATDDDDFSVESAQRRADDSSLPSTSEPTQGRGEGPQAEAEAEAEAEAAAAAAAENVDKRKRQPSLDSDSLVDVHSVVGEQRQQQHQQQHQQQEQPSSSPPLSTTTTATRAIPVVASLRRPSRQRHGQDESEAQLWRDWLSARSSPSLRSLLSVYPFASSPVSSPSPASGWLLASPQAKPLLWEHQPQAMFTPRDFYHIASTPEVR